VQFTLARADACSRHNAFRLLPHTALRFGSALITEYIAHCARRGDTASVDRTTGCAQAVRPMQNAMRHQGSCGVQGFGH